jgi:teichoic acid transport system ATP-binding protein
VSDTQRLSVRVTDVEIDYEVFGDSRAGLRSRFIDRTASRRSFVHAIRGVSFDVHEGEALGLIGFNGSGKSTLLSAIAGVLPVTSGEILVADEPKLMGVGSALVAQASGYRNIRLGCLALGMSADEADERMDDLVRSTNLGDAIHRPLNTYSSGMRARVHFVIATAITPKILLIDEALSVGDRRFRKASRRRIEQIIGGAGTLLMVNHSLGELKSYCTRALWLDEGLIRMDGPIDDVIEAYSDESSEGPEDSEGSAGPGKSARGSSP